jgi:hypothetical protein
MSKQDKDENVRRSDLKKINERKKSQNPLIPVSPKDFKETAESDVFTIDQLGVQHVTDPLTGAEIGPESDPNLMCMMTGRVWNSQFVTLTKKGNKGESP